VEILVMAQKTLLRSRPFVLLAVLVITVLAAIGYAQYRASASAAREAALRAQLFTTRDAIDARNAGSEKRRLPVGTQGKGTAR
jgi:hypothetical protein